jgi:hypothetical protein
MPVRSAGVGRLHAHVHRAVGSVGVYGASGIEPRTRAVPCAPRGMYASILAAITHPQSSTPGALGSVSWPDRRADSDVRRSAPSGDEWTSDVRRFDSCGESWSPGACERMVFSFLVHPIGGHDGTSARHPHPARRCSHGVVAERRAVSSFKGLARGFVTAARVLPLAAVVFIGCVYRLPW